MDETQVIISYRLAAAGEKVEKYGMTQVNAHEYREVIAGQVRIFNSSMDK